MRPCETYGTYGTILDHMWTCNAKWAMRGHTGLYGPIVGHMGPHGKVHPGGTGGPALLSDIDVLLT